MIEHRSHEDPIDSFGLVGADCVARFEDAREAEIVVLFYYTAYRVLKSVLLAWEDVWQLVTRSSHLLHDNNYNYCDRKQRHQKFTYPRMSHLS